LLLLVGDLFELKPVFSLVDAGGLVS